MVAVIVNFQKMGCKQSYEKPSKDGNNIIGLTDIAYREETVQTVEEVRGRSQKPGTWIFV